MQSMKSTFDRITADLDQRFVHAPIVKAPRWQSTDAPAPMAELFNISITVPTMGVEDLDNYREAIRPNLPWADRHFEEERVSGEPINPGETWKIWPFSQSAETHIRDQGKYDHSYAERYWPKDAEGGKLKGYRFPIGDLNDLVAALATDPLTRQAYLPVWFPEDLGAIAEGARVPCTLGYHFIMRSGQLHVVYPMRSCDYIRHFRDDVYLTFRLMLWVLDRLRDLSSQWAGVMPGTLRMHMTSLHMFELDQTNLRHRLESKQ